MRLEKPKKRPQRIEEMFTKEQVIEALWEAEGDVKATALSLGVHYSSIYTYLEIDLDVNAEWKKAKKYFKRAKVEECEKMLYERQEQKKSLPTSLSAITYFLDTHGKEEGWGSDRLALERKVADLEATLEKEKKEKLMIKQSMLGSPALPIEE